MYSALLLARIAHVRSRGRARVARDVARQAEARLCASNTRDGRRGSRRHVCARDCIHEHVTVYV